MEIEPEKTQKSKSKPKKKEEKNPFIPNEMTTKTKKTKEYKTRTDDFAKPKTSQELKVELKVDRQNRKNQLRKNKMFEYFMKKRGLIDADGNTSAEISKYKSLSISNLSKIIDLTQYKIPPKIVSLIQLNDDADLDLFLNDFSKLLYDNFNDVEKSIKTEYKLNNNIVSYLVPNKLYKGKERITFIKTSRDFYSILDACKVSDLLVFVASCKKCDVNNWDKKDPDLYANCIDKFGYETISLVRAQGMADHFCLTQHLKAIPTKKRNDVLKLYNRYFESEFHAKKCFGFSNEGNNLSDENEYKSILRMICANIPYSKHLELHKFRSYMLVEDVRACQGNKVDILGYIHGNTLSIGKYVHVTGFGDYKVLEVDIVPEPLPVKGKYTKEESTMQVEDKKIKNESKITSAVNNDQVESTSNANNINSDNQPEKISAEGVIPEKKESIDIDEDIDFNLEIKDDDDDISLSSDPELDAKEIADLKNPSKKHKDLTTLQARKKEDMEFADEVDTPLDVPAKERFRKYKGLETFKKGSWSPNINLPREYSHIFSFENIKSNFKSAVKTAKDGMKISGEYVKITVSDFDLEFFKKYIRADVPIVLSTLLDHERKLCVMHYKFLANFEENDNIISSLNKKVVECHCGFRRYLIKPIFSCDTYGGTDKYKYTKHLEKDKNYIFSCYAQMTYMNTPVILLHRNVTNDNYTFSLLGTGTTIETSASRIILKKIVLTGYPFKVNKKKAIVRYMFFNPGDINYFKPIQLTTRKGLRGTILESVGTHGYMKCAFNNVVGQDDTVCLNLYKRVFPVWFKETWRYKIAFGNREDTVQYFKDK